VVTGTLWSGTAARGDEVEILPEGRHARVRSVEVHDEPHERAAAGQRVALNLAGVRRDEVARGDVIVAAGHAASATYRVDVALSWAAPDARSDGGARVGVHHGTRESPARIVELGGRFFQLRLEQPIVALRGDRLVIRSLAPPDTLGGGVVLDATPRRHGPSRDLLARLTALERGDEPVAVEPAAAEPGAEERSAPPPLTDADHAVEARLRAAGTAPPPDQELGREALGRLRAHGRAVRLGRAMHIHADALAEVTQQLVTAIERDGSITLAGARDELKTSRKYAQAYLEHLDAEHVTIRRGDTRELRRRIR
jgi:selenocysteine-specific elongation factor